MIIVGGLYRETCEVPYWNAYFGSGGRAASAIARLSPGTELHTYLAPPIALVTSEFERRGIRVVSVPSRTNIVFSYFHPLSRPYIAPAPATLQPEAPLHVEGSNLVRFGFVEGDAIVKAHRAVYDPQTSSKASTFRENGSTADELAIVLNEGELRLMGGSSDILEASRNLIVKEGATFVVAKGGIRGATIFYASGDMLRIPPYKSQSVFKIGTGDIFTAVFAYYWADARKPEGEAANLASRAVASYAETRQLPILPNSGAELTPISVDQTGTVLLIGATHNIEDRWLMEEARWCLRDLGLSVACPNLDGSTEQTYETITAALVIANEEIDSINLETAISHNLPTVVFTQSNRPIGQNCRIALTTSEFVTAIYAACWLAVGRKA